MLKIFKPEVFQGNLLKTNYFEGWYFKHVSANEEHVYAFIPGVSLSENDPHAFIQIINGITGETHYITYDKSEFSARTDKLWVKVGNSLFTNQAIQLDISTDDLSVKGNLVYKNLSPFPKTILSPGIMGWYSYVPFMECYHGVVSANHFIEGKLHINYKNIDFGGGKGYIEKDWGVSFPECWIWLQSNSFKHPNASVFVSIAKIPWQGKYFMGFIAFLYLDGKYIKFATYNGSKLIKTDYENGILKITLKNNKYRLVVEARSKKSGELIAPVTGNMSRRIKESIDSEVSVQLYDKKNNLVFNDESGRAGLEIIEGIFEYLE